MGGDILGKGHCGHFHPTYVFGAWDKLLTLELLSFLENHNPCTCKLLVT